ncbi:polysaccharide pyruvyl transferase family protein [Thauera sinica]|uniref:Polysaccharide pyruvyl transferase family protein n=1 Tax=Thauera sinica TaxID=2665146 RepID=A0ABW1AQT8_9RHOO|nr:polysaccharide pyruvyl transferase family protein [Thauera sp. K11]ATE59728.1 chromosome condensation regulator RCC1 [Thauera sp. K11]
MQPRTILFGAVDRHNFGDLLLAHCAAAGLAGREPVFAGLAARDLRPWGGHRVQALADVIAMHGDEPAELVHVGGEILTTTAWEAAVMLQAPDEARRAISRFGRDPAGQRAWASQCLGTPRALPYVLGPPELPPAWTSRFVAAGGVAADRLPAEAMGELETALRAADAVSVRDRGTQAALARRGVRAELQPDPAAWTRGLFGGRIAERLAGGLLAGQRRRQPRWLALQLAAAWGDDAALARVARAAAVEARARRAGIVLFCAGLAPWHDDPEVLQRLSSQIARLVPGIPAEIFPSADVFDLCALLAGASSYLGTSLHGWIVAASFGVPARCLVEGGTAKAAAYADTWSGAPGSGWIAFGDLPQCDDA